ncbi:hypothetical protein BJV74DRAFT_817787 [Russula compacta]|nr:hypothetical protein BJV74DRAFT_817787 [Russula compacta]
MDIWCFGRSLSPIIIICKTKTTTQVCTVDTETRPSHKDQRTHRTCILRRLNGWMRDECRVRAGNRNGGHTGPRDTTRNAAITKVSSRPSAETAPMAQLQWRYKRVD